MLHYINISFARLGVALFLLATLDFHFIMLAVALIADAACDSYFLYRARRRAAMLAEVEEAE